MVENQLVISIYAEIVIIQHVIHAKATCIETDPVIFASKVEFRIRSHSVTQELVSGGQQQSFPILFSAHRECVVPRFASEQCLVR